MKLFDELKTELDQDASKAVVRVAVGLSGRAAEAFLSLHQGLGGEDVISRNALAARILSRVLLQGKA